MTVARLFIYYTVKSVYYTLLIRILYTLDTVKGHEENRATFKPSLDRNIIMSLNIMEWPYPACSGI